MLSVEIRVWAVHGFHALRDLACVFDPNGPLDDGKALILGRDKPHLKARCRIDPCARALSALSIKFTRCIGLLPITQQLIR